MSKNVLNLVEYLKKPLTPFEKGGIYRLKWLFPLFQRG